MARPWDAKRAWLAPLLGLMLLSLAGNAWLLSRLLGREPIPDGYVPFRLVDFYGPSASTVFPYYVYRAPDDAAFRRRVTFVMDAYGIESRNLGDIVVVPQEISENKALMAVVSARAYEPEWLSARGYEGHEWVRPLRKREGDIERTLAEYWKAVAEGRPLRDESR